MNAKVHEIAQKVAQNGFSWVEDGNALLAICGELAAEFPRTVASPDGKAAVRQYLLSSLILLDRIHNWVMRGKTQAQEEQLYGMFVDIFLQNYATAPTTK